MVRGSFRWGSVWRRLALWAGVVALLATLAPVGQAGAAATQPTQPTPSITLDPSRGPCATRPVVRGAGWPAGALISIFSERTSPPGEKPGSQIAEARAGADGAFAVTLLVIGGDCIDLDERTPNGTQYTITAGVAATDGPLARAVFTIDRTVPVNYQCFAETNYCVQGRFLEYWRNHGGLPTNGYPISEEFEQRLEDGKTYTVQYFERVRMEYHPEHAGTPYEVLLGQFGVRIYLSVPGRSLIPAMPKPGATFFISSSHNVNPDFLAYWQQHGGLMQFGYPMTEEFEEQLEDGRTYTVQYFERAPFERHPENPTPYTILLGQFGRRILAETTGRQP